MSWSPFNLSSSPELLVVLDLILVHSVTIGLCFDVRSCLHKFRAASAVRQMIRVGLLLGIFRVAFTRSLHARLSSGVSDWLPRTIALCLVEDMGVYWLHRLLISKRSLYRFSTNAYDFPLAFHPQYPASAGSTLDVAVWLVTVIVAQALVQPSQWALRMWVMLRTTETLAMANATGTDLSWVAIQCTRLVCALQALHRTPNGVLILIAITVAQAQTLAARCLTKPGKMVRPECAQLVGLPMVTSLMIFLLGECIMTKNQLPSIIGFASFVLALGAPFLLQLLQGACATTIYCQLI